MIVPTLVAGQRSAGKETIARNQELAKEDLVGGTDTSGKEYAVSDAEKRLGGEDDAETKAFAGDKVTGPVLQPLTPAPNLSRADQLKIRRVQVSVVAW